MNGGPNDQGQRPTGAGRAHGPRNFGHGRAARTGGPPGDVVERARAYAASRSAVESAPQGPSTPVVPASNAWNDSANRLVPAAGQRHFQGGRPDRRSPAEKTAANERGRLEKVRRGRKILGITLLALGVLWLTSTVLGRSIGDGSRIGVPIAGGFEDGGDAAAVALGLVAAIFLLVGAFNGLGWTKLHGFLRFIILLPTCTAIGVLLTIPAVERLAAAIDYRHVATRVDGALVEYVDPSASKVRLVSPYWRGRQLSVQLPAEQMGSVAVGQFALVTSEQTEDFRMRALKVALKTPTGEVVIEP